MKMKKLIHFIYKSRIKLNLSTMHDQALTLTLRPLFIILCILLAFWFWYGGLTIDVSYFISESISYNTTIVTKNSMKICFVCKILWYIAAAVIPTHFYGFKWGILKIVNPLCCNLIKIKLNFCFGHIFFIFFFIIYFVGHI